MLTQCFTLVNFKGATLTEDFLFVNKHEYKILFSPSPALQTYHVRITIQWVAIKKCIADSVFGENGQSTAYDATAKETCDKKL